MSALPEPRPVRVVDNVDADRFHQDIRPATQPVLMPGIVADWPAVAAAQRSDTAFVDYLSGCAPQRPVSYLYGEPSEKGRFFYNSRLTGFNFRKDQVRFEEFLQWLLEAAQAAEPPALAVQSEIIRELMPHMAQENVLDWLPHVSPRIWIGNRIRVAAHYDLMENVAICVSGQRRFTLFPPNAMADLYPGPFELTPAGTPVSMVDFAAPDLSVFPRFPQAMARAQVAELTPGDALYIPYGWWHAVESLAPVSTLVNYWWSDADTMLAGPYDALLYAVAAFRHLPPEQRAVWKGMVDHYVFELNGPPAAHLPPHARGLLGDASPALFARFQQMLKQLLR
ncbi:cupin-like domain-containing protein [Erythrobacter sp. EC-HK427]|uniref:cupin-like domain-containing protein n=1 Tax=Erythrobacter sp. EC-HK427 TaxID=2038396 RepID=UPI00125228DA|nr:cupin-like domain-containing protein [Erythrobacter sp. EC-HK427]VVT01149.1 Cupin-like domain-containing protein [Erythrobacter sp. EC-HK427]